MIRKLALWCFAQLPVDAQFACVARWTFENSFDLKRRKPLGQPATVVPIRKLRERRS